MTEELSKAHAACEAADAKALEALRAAYTPGMWVQWMHGSHVREGEVVEVIGFLYRHAQIRVITHAGAEVDICAQRIRAGVE